MSSEQEIRETLEGEFTLDVVNFRKHNPGKTSGWIKLANDWFDDPAVQRLTPTQRYLFVTLLSLRGNKQEPIGNLCVTSLQRRVNLTGRSLKPSLIKLCNEGLISLERKKEREERGEEEGLSAPSSLNSVLPELVGIDDECLSQLTTAAQKSWVRKFGVELIRSTVPTAHSTWTTTAPKRRNTGELVPLIPYVHRWLENGLRYPSNTPKELGEADFVQMLKDHDAKRGVS